MEQLLYVLAAATQAWWQTILVSVLEVVGVTLVPALVAYLVAVLRKHKIKVEYDMAWDLVSRAVARAEQWWKTALKDGADPKDKAAKTLQMATDYLEKLLEQYKLPKMARDALIDLIETRVGEINTAKEKEGAG